MNHYLNYLVEANLSLAFFLASYLLVLRKETIFGFQRMFLLTGIIASLIFPLVHISFSGTRIPSLGQLIPSYLLPEVTIQAEGSPSLLHTFQGKVDYWHYIELIYIGGILFFLSRFFLQLIQLTRKLTCSTPHQVGIYKVIESPEHQHTFSFFNYIFLGQSNVLTAEEKNRVIRHEAVHARQLHSLDLLLLNLVTIFFWFNPLLIIYRKIFIQLHEFEADARAVQNRDVNAYCILLAKVALQSADFPLANHFNNSLTLKRITMMNTLKHKIKTWKMVAVASALPLVFVIIACQDQVATEAQKLAKSTTTAIDIPLEIQSKMEELENKKPEKKFVVIETTTAEGMATLEKIKEDEIASMNIITPTAQTNEPLRTFVIIEYKSLMETLTDPGDKIYDVVDETAMPVGGLPKFYEYVAKNIRYPAEARKKGIEGKVFVEFIVDVNGDVDVTGVSGIGAECDLEVMRVMQMSPKWIPGKNKNIPVKQKMILPITFTIAGSDYTDAAQTPVGSMTEMVVAGIKAK